MAGLGKECTHSDMKCTELHPLINLILGSNFRSDFEWRDCRMTLAPSAVRLTLAVDDDTH